MRLVPRTSLGMATAATLIGGGFAVAAATPSHGVKASPATCTSIRITLGCSQGTAGSLDQNIRFTNTGSVGCRLSGHPGVAFVNAHRVLVGWHLAPFTTARKGARPHVVIPPGKEAAATMRIPDYANFAPMDCIRDNAHLIRGVLRREDRVAALGPHRVHLEYARSYIGQVTVPR